MLYEKIKSISKEKKISIREIELDIGVCPKSLSNWSSNTPSYDKVAKVAKKLGVPIGDLIDPNEFQLESEK